MTRKHSGWRSLNTRVTLLSLAIFLTGIWALTLYVSTWLHSDVKHVLTVQQAAITSISARQINEDLTSRLTALEKFSGTKITAGHMANPAALLSQLDRGKELRELFNAGVWVSGQDGIVVASDLPVLVGKSYADRDYLVTVLKEGRPAISKPIQGKVLKDPIVVLAVPVRNQQSEVIGAIAGVTDLSKPNFLDKIKQGIYGASGGYLLVAPQHGLIVTASDKSRIMETLPAAGVSPTLDLRAQGDESTFVFVNPRGVEVLSSAKAIPIAGWYLASTLPTAEAFAPIHNMLQRTLWVSLALTLVAGVLTWWMVRRQLSPMLAAVKVLAARAGSNDSTQPLAIARQDEVGELIGSFNHLLFKLKERENWLSVERKLLQNIVDSSPSLIFTLDLQHRFTLVNVACSRFFSLPKDQLVGKNIDDVLPNVPAKKLIEANQKIVQTGESIITEAVLQQDPSSAPSVLMSQKFPLRDESGTIYGVGEVATDVTEQRQLEESQARIVERLALATKASGVGIWEYDIINNLSVWDAAMYPLYGMTNDRYGDVYEAWRSCLHPDDRRRCEAEIQAAIEGLGGYESEYRVVWPDGSIHNLRATALVQRDANGKPKRMVGTNWDITAQKQAEGVLVKALHDKSALVQEVNHRVKNNLQVITSLLRLEAGRSNIADTKSVLSDMRWRIRAMAHLHESLYRSGTFASVDLGTYLSDLVTQAFKAQDMHDGLVQLKLNLGSVLVGMDQATAAGLLLNELISNCLKHGFPNGRCGVIAVELQAFNDTEPMQANLWRLRVFDTGVGLPLDFEERRKKSLGLQLAQDLSDQLGGTLSMESTPGQGAQFSTEFLVQTPAPPVTEA